MTKAFRSSLLCLATAVLGGCGDAMAERCNERGGIYAKVWLTNRNETPIQRDRSYCFKPDTISLSVPRPAGAP